MQHAMGTRYFNLASSLFLTVTLFSFAAAAQDMQFGLDENGEAAPAAESQPQPTGEGDVIAEMAAGDRVVDAPSATRDTPVRSEVREEIYAVQRIFALRLNRIELMPSVSFTLNDPFVSHTGVGLALNYWWTNVLAVGLSGTWYEGLESRSDLNFQVQRSTRLGVPVNEYQFGAHLNFTYVPIYGKFSMFNEFIFQYDIYAVGGVGLMRTRPFPTIDRDVRKFDFDIRVAFNLGIGLRVFVTRWFAIFGEIRNYMYLEQVENLDIQLGATREDASTWTQSSPQFVNAVTAHLGLTFFLPPEFEYRLPR